MSPLARRARRISTIALFAFSLALLSTTSSWASPEEPDALELLSSPRLTADFGASAPTIARPAASLSLFEEKASSTPKAESTPASPPKPWRFNNHFNLPEWLSISGTHRQRYEYVFNQFRAGRGGDNRIWPIRTLILGEARHENLALGAELQDSRAYNTNTETPINTTSVNPLELLQAYGKYAFSNSNVEGYVKAGRLTVDFGSRRLVARNRYRNTINSFTGFQGEAKTESGWFTKAIYALPIQRRPSERRKLEENHAEFDREDDEVQFWGLFVRTPELPGKFFVEMYCFGLHEEDANDRATRDRELYTPGFRIYKKPAAEEFDMQLEGAYQFGHSRLSTSGTAPRLNHYAFYVHATLGYTFDCPWKPRILAQFDYASGDRNPGDSHNGRFDTLFGARRFEYGPTGIYGAFARANIISPGVRVQVKPTDKVSSFLAYRPFFLAEQRDAWTTSGLQDTTGDSGDFIGHQFDWRLRWRVRPKSVLFECGTAILLRGNFLKDVPGSNSGEPVVVYTQVVFTF